MLITWLVVAMQILTLYQSIRVSRFSLRTIKNLPTNRPHKAAMICPCKGIDTTFETNISSMLCQGHPDYQIIFVIEDKADPAYEALQRIIASNKDKTTANNVEIVIAGHAVNNSQKVHNLLAAVKHTAEDREIFAFVDSDGCLPEHFLHSLGSQLWRMDRNIVATGYRWFVPEDDKLSSHTLSAVNAFFAGSLGDHHWNSAWGGAMAISKENFYKLKVDHIWQGTLSDDYAMTWAVRNNSEGNIYYMPHCLLPSFEKTSWSNLISFARRQFIITRRCLLGLWLLALTAFSQYIITMWGGLAFAVYLWATGSPLAVKAMILPAATYIGSTLKAMLRQYTTAKMLNKWSDRLKKSAFIDIWCQPVLAVFTWSIIISTTFSKTIVWRHKKYTIVSIDKTIIEQQD